MLITYKILSVLLDYPRKEAQALLPKIPELLEKDGLLNHYSIKCVSKFIESFRQEDLLDWQQTYTGLFDYMPTTSLYLFDHVYGDSRKRGMAMVDLKQLYKIEGMEIVDNELPDYLPLFLEFIATKNNKQEGANLLAEARLILEKIETNLKKAKSAYHFLFEPLLFLASKGHAEPLTEEDKKEIEKMSNCQSCFFANNSSIEENINEY